MFDLTADPLACDKLTCMENVTIHAYQEIEEFVGNDKLEGVRFKSSQDGTQNEVSCDGVFEYIGLKPTADAFKDLGILDDFGYISANPNIQTTIPGIYAAGDIIAKDLRQIVTACSDGATAANNAAKYVESI